MAIGELLGILLMLTVSGFTVLLFWAMLCPPKPVDWDAMDQDQFEHPENWPGLSDE